MILYIGNILSTRGGSVSFIETMNLKLGDRYAIKTISSIQSKPIRLLHMLLSVCWYRNKCKVVLIDTFSTQAFWFAYAVSRLCLLLKLPYIPIIRGGNFLNRMHRSRYFSDKLLRGGDYTIVPSTFLEHNFLLAGYSVLYIPNFIELENYPFKKREILKPRILWVRAFHVIYNPLLAIEVISVLNNQHVHLCMVGSDTDGTRSKVEKRIAALNLENQILLKGRLLKKEWVELSKSYDIFINTTTIDNMPVSVIEAMALGLPVVSTNVGGIPYLLEHEKNALLVPSDDPVEMAEAISKLLNDPAIAQQLSFEARKKVEKFAWDKVKIKWFTVLDKFVEPK